MAADYRECGTAVATKRTQRAPLRAGNLRNEPNGVGRKVGKSRERTHRVGGVAPKPRERSHSHRVDKDCTDRRNRIIAGSQGDGANRQNKATILGEEWITLIVGIVPTSGGQMRIARAGRSSVRLMGGIGAPEPNFPAISGGHALRRGPVDRSGGGRHGLSGLAAPVRVRPLPRCWYGLDDFGQEAVRRCGLTGPERRVGSPRGVRIVRARRQSPGGPAAGTRRHPGASSVVAHRGLPATMVV
jgi:hypothetical protein